MKGNSNRCITEQKIVLEDTLRRKKKMREKESFGATKYKKLQY